MSTTLAIVSQGGHVAKVTQNYKTMLIYRWTNYFEFCKYTVSEISLGSIRIKKSRVLTCIKYHSLRRTARCIVKFKFEYIFFINLHICHLNHTFLSIGPADKHSYARCWIRSTWETFVTVVKIEYSCNISRMNTFHFTPLVTHQEDHGTQNMHPKIKEFLSKNTKKKLDILVSFVACQ